MEAANLIRQSIKDSVWMVLIMGHVSLEGIFLIIKQTIGRKLNKDHPPEPTFLEGL